MSNELETQINDELLKDKIFNLEIYDGSKTLFKGKEIFDAEESKKIGLRYLSPKHTYDPYNKG